MNGLFCILVLAGLAVLTLGFLFVPTKKRRDGGYRDPARRRYAGEPGDGIHQGTYGDRYIGAYGGFGGGHDGAGGFGGGCDGAGGSSGGDCGGGF